VLRAGSAALVRDLGAKMKMTLFARSQGPDRDAIARLVELLRAYEAAAGGNVEVVLAPPRDGQSDDEARIIVAYRGKEDTIGPIKTLELRDGGLEYVISLHVRQIRDWVEGTAPHFGVVQKPGIGLDDENMIVAGDKPGPTMRGLMAQHFPFVHIDGVDLLGGKRAVDQKLVGLIVTQASSDWTDEELARLDEFVMRGGKTLVVLASAVELRPGNATMQAKLDLHRIDTLVGGYGIEMQKAAVFEWSEMLRFPVQEASGAQRWVTLPGIMVLGNAASKKEPKSVDDTFPPFFRVDPIAVPFPSPLLPHPERQPRAALRAVLRSSSDAWQVTQAPVDFSFPQEWPVANERDRARQVVAIEATGILASALPTGGATRPESKSPSRVLVIASGLLFANPLAYACNSAPQKAPARAKPCSNAALTLLSPAYANMHLMNSTLVFKNLFDWMAPPLDGF
jgi:hypothetical protein